MCTPSQPRPERGECCAAAETGSKLYLVCVARHTKYSLRTILQFPRVGGKTDPVFRVLMTIETIITMRCKIIEANQGSI